MSNILVVGINGTIGGALFSHLQSLAKKVWGTTHKTTNTATNVFYLNLLDDPTHWDFANITFDVVYLCAGICKMALCEDDPVQTYQVNIVGMGRLAEYFAKRGAFIVYLSTNQVFSGETSHTPTTATCQPNNEYGRQKAWMEQLITTHCPQFAILRLTKVVEPNLALIKTWIDHLLLGKTITAFHDMTLAPISLQSVIETLFILGQKKQSGYYHLSGKHDVSYFDLAIYLANIFQCDTSLVQSVSALQNGIKKIFLPRFTTLDCSSTIASCGRIPPHFSEVLQECFDLPK